MAETTYHNDKIYILREIKEKLGLTDDDLAVGVGALYEPRPLHPVAGLVQLPLFGREKG